MTPISLLPTLILTVACMCPLLPLVALVAVTLCAVAYPASSSATTAKCEVPIAALARVTGSVARYVVVQWVRDNTFAHIPP